MRVEIGPKDMENQAVSGAQTYRNSLFAWTWQAKAGESARKPFRRICWRRAHREAHNYTVTEWDEFVDTINNKPGF